MRQLDQFLNQPAALIAYHGKMTGISETDRVLS